MDVCLAVVESVLSWWCPYVASLEPISFESAVYHCCKHVVSDIKLSSLVQKWSFDVFLEDKGLWSAIIMLTSSFQNVLNLLKWEANYDSIASVCKLSRLDNPNIIEPILFGLFLSLVESLQEVRILLIIDAFFDMEWKRKEIEDSFANWFIVLGHRIQEGFFVADDVVVGKMVLHPDCFRGRWDHICFFDEKPSLVEIFTDLLFYFSILCPIFIPKHHIILVHYLQVVLIPTLDILRQMLSHTERRGLTIRLKIEIVV